MMTAGNEGNNPGNNLHRRSSATKSKNLNSRSRYKVESARGHKKFTVESRDLIYEPHPHLLAAMSAEERNDAAKPVAVTKRKPTSAKFPRTRRFSYETPERLKELERNFVLDGAVLSRLTNDETGRTNPSLNFGIPQYRAKEDKHCKSYFTHKGLPKTATDKVQCD